MTTRYLDFDGGNDANDGTTFALRKKSMSSVAGASAGGDTIRVMASPAATSLAQNATFTNGSDTVTLTTAVTANIDTCESAWTGSANVTASAQSATQREGTNACKLVIAAAFTTGLVGYHAMSSTDFSAYQQVSFLVRANAAIAAGVLTLTLCSDAAGVTAVNTIAIPAISSGYWTAVVVDTGGALGSAIQSIALNALSDPGTVTVFFDNVIACKASSAADSLTHYSLISKNTGTEPWMAIDSINGTTIKLAGGYQATASRTGMLPYYYGATATQTLYKREPIILATTVTGSLGALTIECGWDRTAMTTQSGQTFCRFRDPNQSTTALFDAQTSSSSSLNRWYSVNSAAGGILIGQHWTLGEIGAIACAQFGLGLYQACDTQAVSSATRYAIHCTTGIKFAGSFSGYNVETRLRFNYLWGYDNTSFQNPAINDISSATFGRFVVYGCDIQGFYCYSGGSGLARGGNAEGVFQNCTIKNLNRETSGGPDKVWLINCTLTNTGTVTVPSNGALYYTNQGGDTTSHKILYGIYFAQQSSVYSDTSTRHTASDFSWKLTSNGAGGVYTPSVFLSVAKIACVANEQRTVTAWMRRASTSLVTRLRVKGGYVQGIDDDVTANMTAAINTWEQITLQFTPTQQCVVEVFAECYGAANDAWIDDLAVS